MTGDGRDEQPAASSEAQAAPESFSAQAPGAGLSPAAAVPALAPWLAGLLFLGGIFFAYQIVGSLITYLFLGATITPENLNGMRIATVLAQVVFLAGPVLLLAAVRRWRVRETLRLHAMSWGPALAVILSVAALQFMLQGYMMAQEHVLRTYILTPELEKLYDAVESLVSGLYKSLLGMRSPGELLFVWLVVALTPAVCEELVFRGVAQRAFERSMRARWAIGLNAAIFALFHLYPTQFVALTCVGLLLGYVVWRGNSLYYGILAHVTNNTISVLSVYVFGFDAASQEVAAASSARDTAWLSLAGTVVLVVALVIFHRLTARRDSSPSSITFA